MLPLIIGGSLAATALVYLVWPKKKDPVIVKDAPMPTTPKNHEDMVAQAAMLVPQSTLDMVPVDLNGETWMVSRNYIGPVGIGEAAEIAKQAGMELPSPALVDAIWRQADLKILPPTRAKNEPTQAVFNDQKRRIADLIAGREFTLLGGTFKDVVQVNGAPQLYGWHVEDGKNVGIPLHKPVTPGPGKVIQPPSGKAHGLFFKDYSQGVRLVHRKV